MSGWRAQFGSGLARLCSGWGLRVAGWVRTFSGSVLRTRLFLNLLPFVVILLAVGIYAIALFLRLANSVEATVTQNYRSIQAVQGMSTILGRMKEDLGRGALTGNTDQRALSEGQRQFETNLAWQLQCVALPGEKGLNQELLAHYRAFQKEIIALRRPLRTPKGQPEADIQALVARAGRLGSVLDRIRDLNYRAILSTSEQIREITRHVTGLMLIGLCIALIVSAYASYQLRCSILQPIQWLTKATRELGEGNLNQPVPVISRDELGELAVSFNRMAAQLHEYRQSTTEEIVRLHRTTEATLASFPDPIFVLGRDGRIELKNPAAAELVSRLGLKEELPGQLQDRAKKILESGEDFLPHSFEEVISLRIEGVEKFFLPRILAMRHKDNARFGVAVVLYDVTRFRLLDAVKTNLVATVSHELKSPLTSVRMVLHVLLEKAVGALTPKQDELLVAARNDTERVLRILNDLLDLARLEEGAAALNKEKVHPTELLHGVMEEMSDKVLAQGLKARCVVAQNLPTVSVDRQRINLVFTNLIANAIKHSPPGGEIVLGAAPGKENGVEFSVTDEGPGIPVEYRARIFDRFYRVPGQTKPGAGLGLSIAKEITVAHGGRINVRPGPRRGTTFVVVLNGDA